MKYKEEYWKNVWNEKAVRFNDYANVISTSEYGAEDRKKALLYTKGFEAGRKYERENLKKEVIKLARKIVELVGHQLQTKY